MQANRYENRIVTLPNALSLLRILMIPVFVWLYCAKKAYHWSAAVVVATGLTDVLDGILARKLHMESNVGRVLDPLADKLAQAALCIVMMFRYPVMLWVLIFLAVKEVILAALGYAYMKRTGIIADARWYGKASSVVLYATMVALMLSPDITAYSANVLIALLAGTHAVSLLLYAVFYIRALRNPAHVPGAAMRPIDWQVMVMYLLLMLSFFLLMFTSGESFLRDVLPKPIYLFLRFASIVGTLGVPAFFLGEKLPRKWFHPDRFPFRSFVWEKDGKIYEKIGIQWWKNRTPDMSKYIRRAFPKQGNLLRDPDHLRKLVVETCSAEFVHWVLILLSPLFAILMDELGVLAMILYIIGNLVSLVIQRYNRPRIMKIIQRIEKRKCADS